MGLPKALLASRALSLDKMNMLPRNAAANAAHEALFPLQECSPEEIVLGIATLFAAVMDRAGVDPEEMYHKGHRLLASTVEGDAAGNGSVQVLKDFVALKVLAQEVSIS